MKHDPKNPKWEERDRFFLSKGHAAPLLYAILAQAGYFPVEELMTLRKMGSRLQGHPNLGLPGVEAPAGSEGIGLSLGVGTSLAAKLDRKGYRTFVLMGDGEQQEGEVWEAAMGKGISFMEWSPHYHGTAPSKEKMSDVLSELK